MNALLRRNEREVRVKRRPKIVTKIALEGAQARNKRGIRIGIREIVNGRIGIIEIIGNVIGIEEIVTRIEGK